jgi:hypothetical protein
MSSSSSSDSETRKPDQKAVSNERLEETCRASKRSGDIDEVGHAFVCSRERVHAKANCILPEKDKRRSRNNNFRRALTEKDAGMKTTVILVLNFCVLTGGGLT